jgi:hypothetical protein
LQWLPRECEKTNVALITKQDKSEHVCMHIAGFPPLLDVGGFDKQGIKKYLPRG